MPLCLSILLPLCVCLCVVVAAEKWKITVCRVPAYSPYAIAEHAVGLVGNHIANAVVTF